MDETFFALEVVVELPFARCRSVNNFVRARGMYTLTMEKVRRRSNDTFLCFGAFRG
jgi:hypothetical protein